MGLFVLFLKIFQGVCHEISEHYQYIQKKINFLSIYVRSAAPSGLFAEEE